MITFNPQSISAIMLY